MTNLSRKDFFSELTSGLFSPKRQLLTTSLDAHTLPLNKAEVIHLLRRVSFGVSPELLNEYVGKTASQVVDSLFESADKNLSPAAPFFSEERLRNPAGLSGNQKTDEEKKVSKHTGDYNYAVGEWWVKIMRNGHNGLLEKMVLFWHGHFATRFASCSNIPAISMYRQNDLFRKNFAGNFSTLLEKVTIDGAMLRFLNGNENVSESPNENYARELLELFSLGVGHYTEQDIREAAKILTGWQVTMFAEEGVPFEGRLDVNRFDKNTKLFMGEVFTVDYTVNQQNVYENSVKKLIKTILTKKSKEAAIFISEKLYRFFIYANPEATDKKFIESMAQLLISEKFELRPLLKAMFKSKHFFDEQNVGVQIKSPADTVIGFYRHFGYNDMYIRNIMAALGLEVFNPPNVAGWKGYRSWISTKTLPLAIYFLRDEILAGQTNENLANWVRNFEEHKNPENLSAKIAELFLAKAPLGDRHKYFTKVLLGGAPDYEWQEISKNTDLLGQKVRVLLRELIKAPDFYLA